MSVPLGFYVRPSKATTIIVPDDYLTIQAAIAAASDGDTVFVRSGTYLENVEVSKSLNLIGENAETTTINGESYAALVVSGNSCHVAGFTFTSPDFILNPGSALAYVVMVFSSNNVFSSNIFQGIITNQGVNGLQFSLCTNNTVEHNEFSELEGAGVFVYRSHNNTIRNNTITTTEWGIWLEESNYSHIEDNTIRFTTPHYFHPMHDPQNPRWIPPPSGIAVWYHSHWNEILANTVTHTKIVGVSFTNHSSNNLVAYNNITSNGMETSNSWELNCDVYSRFDCHNTFHHNFLDNAGMIRCEGGNSWDSGNPLPRGNYWKDYIGEDLNEDGVWDYHYSIDSFNLDSWPLINETWIGLRVHNLNSALDYLTIQEAIDANETSIGHTIQVDSGFYYAHVVLDKAVTLVGCDPNTTILDGCGSGATLTIMGADLRVSNFTIQNSGVHGVLLTDSLNVTLRNLIMDKLNIQMSSSSSLNHFLHDIDESNLVRNKPVYYWITRHAEQTPSDAGFIAIVNSTEIKIASTMMTDSGQGILFAFTNNSTITNTSLLQNTQGIVLHHSFNNTLQSNNFTNNEYAISLTNSSGNTLYHNNFVDNQHDVYVENPSSPGNTWDNGYPSGGNHWGAYDGADADSDGIGDSVYVLDQGDEDRYPLIHPWAPPNIAVTNIDPNSTMCVEGALLPINVTFENLGLKIIAVDLSVQADQDPTIVGDEVIVGNQTVLLSGGNITTAIFYWNTTSLEKGYYSLLAQASVMNEVDLVDNLIMVAEPVTILSRGHDLAITEANASLEIHLLHFTVTLQNFGSFQETFNVSIYANTTAITTVTNLTLEMGESAVLESTWDTSFSPKGYYDFLFFAWPVPEEVDTYDNYFNAFSRFLITVPGDVDADFDVDIFDIVVIVHAYGTAKGEPEFNSACDIDDDGDVDIFDIVIAAGNYGESW